MDSFISGIIDYVARPSTTDSPVRVVHKKSESEAPCESIDNDGGMESFEVTEISNLIDNDTESTSETDTWGQPSSLLSQFNVVQFNVPDVMRNNSVLTAEGIITCGDLACFNTMMDGDGDNNNRVITAIPEEPTPSIETPVVKQFESAFAHFLYKNPAFWSMSYMTLQKLRSKLLKESAKNMKVEDPFLPSHFSFRHGLNLRHRFFPTRCVHLLNFTRFSVVETIIDYNCTKRF